MASQLQASIHDASPAGFGAWLRSCREARDGLIRTVAAAADIDSSHLGKYERGDRLPSPEHAAAIARALDIDETEMRSRLATAHLWKVCGGDPAAFAAAAGVAHEHAGAYFVNNAANKPANKLRTKK